MRSASVSLTLAVVALVVIGMFPCLGWVQWFGAILAGVAFLVGVIGVVTDDGPKGPHIAAIVVGVLGGGLGSLRLLMGGGIF